MDTHQQEPSRLTHPPMPMAAHAGNLYLVSAAEIFTSVDRGETWRPLDARPKAEAVGIIITDEIQSHVTMYLALKDAGI